MHEPFEIDPDIRRARTLPSAVYHDPRWFELQQERVFAPSWQMFPDPDVPTAPGDVRPWNLLPGCLDEPLLLTRSEADLHCISNVCTHRGKILLERPCTGRKGLRCDYHGRRFALDGRFTSAPGFDGALEHPGPDDDLRPFAVGRWGRFVFASLEPILDFETWFGPVRDRLPPIELDEAEFDPTHSRQYHVRANWALYCDNYLEGLHIPYVHPSLVATLDPQDYPIELLPAGALQIGMVEPDDLTFDLPPEHPDHGRPVGAYYFWLFPTTMINVYPWGLSLNLLQPLGPTATRVVYATWIWDRARHGRGAGAALDQVEYEDEVVVESCARGVRARAYERGRYAPQAERAVHHFHRLLAEALR